MSIRVKFLLVLLVAVLVPTAFAVLVAFVSTTRMAVTVAEDQRENLRREAEGVLLTVVEKNVEIFSQETMVFIAANRSMINAAERSLNAPGGGGDGPFARLPASAFGEGGDAPGLRPSERHGVYENGVSLGPTLVSYDLPAVFIPDGASEDEADRLMGVTPALRAFSMAADRSIMWQFIALDSGVSLVYPGHGMLPDDFDIRQTEFYQRSRQMSGQGAGSGSPPSVDPVTGQTLVGMVMPVRSGAGEVIGISGVLSPVGTVLDGLQFGTEWGEGADNMFVVVMRHQASGELRLFIVARRSYEDAAPDSGGGFLGIDQLEMDDPADTEAVMQAFIEHTSGTRTVSVNGKQMLCAYAGLEGDQVGLVTLVPISSIGTMADEARDRIRERAIAQLGRALGGAAVFSVLMVVAAVFGARLITTPIATLAEAIRKVAGGDLDVRAEVASRDEVGELANAFNGMVPRLRDHLRLRDSLDLAQQVQRKLLPAEPPVVEGLDIAGRSIYCDETGGDYFDFLEFDQPAPGRFTAAVGDVTGHGVAAALLMATARALVRMRVGLPGALGERLADINRHLAHDAETGRFMTLMMLSIDRREGRATWVGAGHDAVLVYDPDTDEFIELEGEDIPLAVEATWQFHERSADVVRSGRVFFLGTDGIWEAFDGHDEMYGKERLRACIRANASKSAGEIVDAIVADVSAFRGDRAQLDDVTLLVVRVE